MPKLHLSLFCKEVTSNWLLAKNQSRKSCDVEVPPNGRIALSAGFCSRTPEFSDATLDEGSHFLFAVPGTLQLSKYLKYNDLAILDMQVLSLEVKSNLHTGCLPDDTVQTANLLVRIYRLFFPSQLFSSHIFRSSCYCSTLSHYIFHLTTRTILFFCEKRYCHYAIMASNPRKCP